MRAPEMTFTDRVNQHLRKVLSPEDQQKYFFETIDNFYTLPGADDYISPFTYQMELLETRLKTDPELQQIFASYQPTMITISQLSAVQAGPVSTPAEQIGLKFYVAGPKVDSYASMGYRCLAGAVVQAASQLNNLEFATPQENHPRELDDDPTQGPAIQKGCPALALARYQWWKTHGEENSFLRNWSNKVVKDSKGNDWTFQRIFEVQNGYMHPRPGMEGAALYFIQQHKDKLLINVEQTEFTPTGTSITQVLAATMAFGRYAAENFRGHVSDRSPEAQQAITQACAELLSVQYEMLARIAVITARANPDKRIPLVLTSAGGGVFENPPEAIAAAKKAAIDFLIQSGVKNIDYVDMAYTNPQLAAAHIQQCLQEKNLSQGVTILDDKQLKGRADFSEEFTAAKQAQAAAAAQQPRGPAVPQAPQIAVDYSVEGDELTYTEGNAAIIISLEGNEPEIVNYGAERNGKWLFSGADVRAASAYVSATGKKRPWNMPSKLWPQDNKKKKTAELCWRSP